MSFNPTTDSGVVLRIDHQSSFYSDTAATTAATLSGNVQSIKDSTGTYTAVLSASSQSIPTLGHVNGHNVVTTSLSGPGYCFSLGQPTALANLINNAIASLTNQTSSGAITILFGGAPGGDCFLLSKGLDTRLLGIASGNLTVNGNAVDSFTHSYTSAMRQFALAAGYNAPGAEAYWARPASDGATTKPIFDIGRSNTTNEILICGVDSDDSGGAPSPYYQMPGTFGYLVIVNRALSQVEIAQAEAFYRGIYALADPRAASPYLLVLVGNSFFTISGYPEAIAAETGLSPASIWNTAYGGEDGNEINATTYPNEVAPLLTYLAGAYPSLTTVVKYNELSNSLIAYNNATTMTTQVTTFVSTCRSAFPSIPVVVGTCLPRQSGVNDTTRIAANTDIISALTGVTGVYIADIASTTANPNMAFASDNTNATYYYDTIHPADPTGTQTLAGISGPVITTASHFNSVPNPPIVPGTITGGTPTGTITLTVTASGGGGTYTGQTYLSTVSGTRGTAVSGATGLTPTLTGLSLNTDYYATINVGDSQSDTPVDSPQFHFRLGGSGATATAYSIVGIPANPVVGETYAVTAIMNNPTSASGTITPTAHSGITWGSAISIGSGGLSGSGTVTFTASGAYTPVFTHSGLGFSGDPTLSSVTAAVGTGPTATAYTVSGFPTSPLVGEVYPITVALNDPASASGVVTFGAVSGITWGSTVSIAQGAVSGSTTATITAAGAYTPAATHTGLGFGGDPTMTGFTASAQSSGITYNQLTTALASIPVIVATNNDKTGYAVSATGLNAVLGFKGWSFPQLVRAIGAFLVGDRSGVPTSGTAGTVTYSDPNGNVAYGTVTVDASGNITSNNMTPVA